MVTKVQLKRSSTASAVPTAGQLDAGELAINTVDMKLYAKRTSDNVVIDLTAGSFTGADRTKLDGIQAGATANATDAALRARSSHTGTQSADTITDGTTNKAFTAANQTKLNGIATAATANDTDANLKNRANHTGSQAISTITGLQTALDNVDGGTF